ncbi:DUF692 domain-containing protein [Thalassomonas viridans]|uniref:DUF692 domain-containing protein n=1 Tax=Thalassomonas viridans TaxID=137584 RepID=A0AAF0CE50_9GAMM|nr:DUF692 domain-containing protein [Thalassomonas viridans]WDE08549.1 DUF692 domain-containing protein [Thalassomonas viridans]
MFPTQVKTPANLPKVGVGLRHAHYQDALDTPANIDFIELHAENFFAAGGVSRALLADIRQHYDISLHATSLGLGSALPAPQAQIQQLADLIRICQPIMVSDHACFSWAEVNGRPVHGGDLLPVPFNDETLEIMAANVSRVQALLKRPILVENLSAYLILPGSTYSESEFLVRLCRLTGCKLLIDINNLVVNAQNHALLQPDSAKLDVIAYTQQWLNTIPQDYVGELHLAGFTPTGEGELVIDDHSQAVSDEVWSLYRFALERFGAVATLIEWDNQLPSWQVLVAEAAKAKAIAAEVFASAYQPDSQQPMTSHHQAVHKVIKEAANHDA